jgi:hypothetical protein
VVGAIVVDMCLGVGDRQSRLRLSAMVKTTWQAWPVVRVGAET